MQANMIRKVAETDPVPLQINASVFQLYWRLLGYVAQHRGRWGWAFSALAG